LPAEFLLRLRAAKRLVGGSPTTIIVLEGPHGARKRSCANALCAEMGCGLLEVDSERLMAPQAESPHLLMLLGREQRLANSGIYFRNAEALFETDGRLQPRARRLAQGLSSCIAPVMIGCSGPCDINTLLPGIGYQLFRFPALPFPLRLKTWDRR
jgi:hypothetical protein